jgi:hypothetical protein
MKETGIFERFVQQQRTSSEGRQGNVIIDRFVQQEGWRVAKVGKGLV